MTWCAGAKSGRFPKNGKGVLHVEGFVVGKTASESAEQEHSTNRPQIHAGTHTSKGMHTGAMCAQRGCISAKKVVFPKSRHSGLFDLASGDKSHQGKPFTTRTAPSKVRMARGNAIQMPIQAASATHRDRKLLAANELMFATLL